MNKLKTVSIVLEICKWLLIAGSIFAGAFILLSEDEVLNVGSPPLKLKDGPLENKVNQVLEIDEELRLFITELDVELPATPQLKAVVITSLVLVVAYMLWALQIIIRIVGDIKRSEAFRHRNIGRLKTLALMIAIAPVLVGLLHSAFTVFVGYSYQLPEAVTFQIGSRIDFTMVVIGLLLYAIAVAFGEGLKMKEEQELTV